MPSSSPYRLLSLAQLSLRLGHPYSLLYAMVRADRLRPVGRVGTTYLFAESELKTIAAQVREQRPPANRRLTVAQRAQAKARMQPQSRCNRRVS